MQTKLQKELDEVVRKARLAWIHAAQEVERSARQVAEGMQAFAEAVKQLEMRSQIQRENLKEWARHRACQGTKERIRGND